ncbi:MAG: hypothetical protein BGO98_41730 [Myxococcales bacterium 68-20]|nr:cadherin-like domain-containing protein [Myxococcales bacterium]OJY27779.1 MAG: hypothetical protein BGO98_41730 [Myxococcales bacterium 68-20]
MHTQSALPPARVFRRARLLLAPLLVGLAVTQFATNASARPKKFVLDEPPPSPPKPPKPEYTKASEGFIWSAQSRAGGWVKAWRPQTWPQKSFPSVQSYDPDYVNPKSWTIDVQGCVDQNDWDRNMAGKNTVNTYTWTANGQVQKGKRCIAQLTFPAQGVHPVTLDVTDASGKKISSKTREVRVRDILIVALGDSMSSGEGSPDSWIFEGTPFKPADWVDRQCHRSKSAPAALAAEAIERMDPTTSVTFLSFACSGATLEKEWALDSAMFDGYEQNEQLNNAGSGILGSYIGIESPAGEHVMSIEEFAKDKRGVMIPGQVAQLKHAVANKRKVDAIVMSAGINDAGFSKMLFTCTLYSDCPNENVGFQPNQIPLKQRFARDVKGIPAAYKRFSHEIAGLANRVLVFEYPNPFTNDNGQTCDDLLEDVISPLPGQLALSMTKYESTWAQSYAEPLLHNAIRAGVRDAGFEFVGGVWNAFRGHGYCASDAQRWVRRATESSAIQGPTLHKNTKGTIHPNFAGYHALSTFIVRALTSREESRRPVAVPDTYSTPGNQLLVVKTGGVLVNDTDPDLIAHLRVVNHTQPNGGKGSKVEVKPDGSFTYNPATNFKGTESFFYTVSDGFLEAVTKVTIKVGDPVNSGPQTPPTISTTRPIILKKL